MNIVLVQCNPSVGHISNNVEQVLNAIKKYSKADLLIFPELMLTGYPPDDLLYEPTIARNIEEAIIHVQSYCPHTMTILLGTPRWNHKQCFNSCAIIEAKRPIRYADKHQLPCYGVFSEPRHFTAGKQQAPINIRGLSCLILVCEDIWHPPQALKESLDLIISLNASPFTQDKFEQRQDVAEQYSAFYNAPVVYCNLVGGQDELVFDGNSFVYHPDQGLQAVASHCQEDSIHYALGHDTNKKVPEKRSPEDSIYQVIRLGLLDYCKKNHIQSAVIGLSGGIDSALCLALLADCFPAKDLHVFYLPSPFNAELSQSLAQEQCDQLGIDLHTIPITPLLNAYETTLGDSIDFHQDLVHQNIQARIRADILMAKANEQQALLVTTSNKSEAAMGYSTLYGDMAGGYAPLKDLLKTQVYQLAHFCNQHCRVIPEAVIHRPPSAELAPNQKDSDSLPDYNKLDLILEHLLAHRNPEQLITDHKIKPHEINTIMSRLYRNEHKRFQMPPGPIVSETALGRDRQWPITHDQMALLID